jgi:SAM-dependent methyltransferase
MTTTSDPAVSADATRFQLSASGPEAYQRYLVPAFFAGCARQLLDLAAPAPGNRVLDVACGTGVVAIEAARRVAPTGSVTGVDLNPGMLAVARSVAAAAAAPVTLRWERADVAQLPFPDASFDLVCCQHGLQFFPEPGRALGEIRRVLAPGGRVAIAIWRPLTHHPPFAALAEALDRHAGEGVGAALRAPFSGRPGAGLRRQLERAGFAGVRLRIGIIGARFPSAAELVRHEALATPAAAAYEALAEPARAGLVAELAEAVADAVDDDGVTFPMQTWFGTGSA